MISCLSGRYSSSTGVQGAYQMQLGATSEMAKECFHVYAGRTVTVNSFLAGAGVDISAMQILVVVSKLLLSLVHQSLTEGEASQ